ncbi:MAG: vWA domain-containing protein [Sandaracinaceae bacterium]
MTRWLMCIAMLGVAAGCDCAGDPSGACDVDGDCDASQACVDGRCEARADASLGGDADVPRDTGPGRDTGPDLDTGVDPEDASCGGEAVAFDYRPPNVLLIFDRSCSMRRVLDGSDFGAGPEDPATRWNVAREAVLGLLGRFPTRVFWGLMAFPDPREGCGMPVDAEVPPGPGAAAAIDAELRTDAIQPFGLCGPDNTDTTTQPRQTPTADALTSAMGLSELMDPMRESFALVVTDGGVSCGVSDSELSTLTESLRMAGIPTAVIGFATGSAESSLEAIASAGGLPNPAGPPSYYVAESRADLDTVFDEIASRVVSCDLALSSTPPDPDALFVNVNDVPLANDATDGWSYDAASNTLTLNGASCDQLRRGDIRRISISFGCAPTPCEPQPEVCNGLDEDCDDIVDEMCLL